MVAVQHLMPAAGSAAWEGMTRTEELDWLLLLLVVYRELLAASTLKGHQPASHNGGGR